MRRYQKKRMKRIEEQKNKTAGNPGADVRPAKDNRAAENILSGSIGADFKVVRREDPYIALSCSVPVLRTDIA